MNATESAYVKTLEHQFSLLKKQNELLTESVRSWREYATDLKIYHNDLIDRYENLDPQGSPNRNENFLSRIPSP